ncbi:response regulator transcription factor [Gordonia aichiensis]|uniref:Putative LuxR family transcriptional regulator n=1 Tax=Gordonia aichiensis NBRC 108223 TaxID=1220583 RepID=L7KFE8_9ACTN|nr:LuxR C-terminal-related transcriptional regulator [Gordonia aichiensis]GAC47216.1 putative LuxR family transcriptional regulator [Gordonia aichiensis NBRC 108223]
MHQTPIVRNRPVSLHQIETIEHEPVRARLSAREIEVLVAWLHSESKEQAARRLFLGTTTVSTHISRIRAKYNAVGRPAPSKAALFVRAIQDGYVSLSDW